MPKTKSQAKEDACGTVLVRLAEVPLEERLAALDKLARHGQIKGSEEAAKLMDLALDPGDRGGRIAA